MKDYETAVRFERAGDVRRVLEYAGRTPTLEDDLYINSLRVRLDELKAARIFAPWTREAREWAEMTQDIGLAQWPEYGT